LFRPTIRKLAAPVNTKPVGVARPNGAAAPKRGLVETPNGPFDRTAGRCHARPKQFVRQARASPVTLSRLVAAGDKETAMRLAARMGRIGTETAFEAAARARALEATGRSVIHLEIGEPDFDTPPNIRAAAKRALDRGATHYTPTVGIPELREAIARDATARKGFNVRADRVVVVPGGKPVMFFAILALVDSGDEVVYPDPGFPIYESMVDYVGGRAVACPIRQENGFRLDPDELASLVTRRTRLLIINSPANPTGGVLTREDLERIASVARKHNLVVLADEIYGRTLYEGEHVSIASLPGMADRTLVLDGFSKTYAMTGWRLGYAILPEKLVLPFSRLIVNSVSCTNAATQWAGVEALTGPQTAVTAMVEEFRARRDLIVDGLNAIPGISCLRPSGAFYVFPDISGTGLTGEQLADKLLYEGGVSALAGTAFGRVGRYHLRFSYANSRENIAEALKRIRTVVEPLAAEHRASAKMAALGVGAALATANEPGAASRVAGAGAPPREAEVAGAGGAPGAARPGGAPAAARPAATPVAGPVASGRPAGQPVHTTPRTRR
jgi:aspartate aminotransferase